MKKSCRTNPTPISTDEKRFSRVWLISDGKAGDIVQCRGVAEALGKDEVIEITIRPCKPYVWMMPYGPVPPDERIGKEASPLHPPFPDLVIASGWRTLAYMRELKQKLGDRVFTVFLKSPRCTASYLDLIWVPAHDRLRGDRVISSLASPHRFSPEMLEADYGQKPDFMNKLAAPVIGVLLGGESKDYHFSDNDCTRLAKSLRALAQAGAGLAITPSRRSSDRLKRTIRQHLAGENIYWWDEKNENPYGHILAHSDYFVITADSANMIGEACVKGKPVYVFRPSGGSKKFDRLLKGFELHGATRPLPEQFNELEVWEYTPLYAASQIARVIVKRAGG